MSYDIENPAELRGEIMRLEQIIRVGKQCEKMERERATRNAEYAEELRALILEARSLMGCVSNMNDPIYLLCRRIDAALAKNAVTNPSGETRGDPGPRASIDSSGGASGERVEGPQSSIAPLTERNLAASWGRWHAYEFASIFRDILCRTLDKAELYAKQGKPLPPDEIAAMTARLVEASERLDSLGRPVKPHASGGGEVVPRVEARPTWGAYNAVSRMHGEMFDLARSYRDTLCRTLDKAEAYAKAGKPLPPDEIAAMTARIEEDDKKLYGEGRPVPPHRSGGASVAAPEGDKL